MIMQLPMLSADGGARQVQILLHSLSCIPDHVPVEHRPHPQTLTISGSCAVDRGKLTRVLTLTTWPSHFQALKSGTRTSRSWPTCGRTQSRRTKSWTWLTYAAPTGTPNTYSKFLAALIIQLKLRSLYLFHADHQPPAMSSIAEDKPRSARSSLITSSLLLPVRQGGNLGTSP